MNVFLLNVAVFLVTAPDEPISLDGLLRALLLSHGMTPANALQDTPLKHTLQQPSQALLQSRLSDVERAIVQARSTASPAGTLNALADACAGEGHGQDSVSLKAAKRLSVPRKLFMESRSDRQATAGVLYVLSLVVLAAYLATNFLLSDETPESGRYVAFVVVAAMLLADAAVGMAYRGGAVGTPGEAMLVITLTRGVALAFGVRLWLLGLLAVYLMVGLWLGVAAVRACFPALREAQAVASAASAGGVAAVNNASASGMSEPALESDDGLDHGEFGVATDAPQEKQRPGHLRRRVQECVLHPGTILFLVTLVFAALVASLAASLDSTRDLPDERLSLTDSNNTYPQWHFALAAIGLVLVFTMSKMAFMFFESDRGVFRGIGFWSCVLTCLVAAGAGIGMWALTDSNIILGFGVFFFPIVFGLAGLWGQFRADDFDVWRPGGLGCTRTCACCYSRHQIAHEQRIEIKEARLLALSRGKRFKDDVSIPTGEAAPSLTAPPSDSDSGGEGNALVGGGSSSDSDMPIYDETVEVTGLSSTQLPKPKHTVTIAEWYAKFRASASGAPASGARPADAALAPAITSSTSVGADAHDQSGMVAAVSLLPETQDNSLVLASSELAVHYPCPEVICCRVPRKSGGCSGCSCAPTCTAHHWRNNYIALTSLLVAGCFVGFAFVASRSLPQPWIAWFLTGESAALVLLLAGLVVSVRTGGLTWLAGDFLVLGSILHILMHLYAWLQLDGGRAVAGQAGTVDDESSTAEEYGVAMSFVLFPTLLVFAAALYEANSKSFKFVSNLSIAAATMSVLVAIGMAVGGIIVLEAPVAVAACLGAFIVFLAGLAFFAKYKSNTEHLPRSWARAGYIILSLLLVLGIVATVLAATVQGSRTAALSWFSLTYLVFAVALLVVSLFVLTRSRILVEDVTGSIEATRITHGNSFLGGSTAIYLSDKFFPVFLASKNGLAQANKWPIMMGVSVLAISAWAVALTVFVTPVYIGLILLVIVKSLSVLFALDVTRRSQARLESAIRHLNGAFHAAKAAASGTRATPAAGTLTQGPESSLKLTVTEGSAGTAGAGDVEDGSGVPAEDAQAGVHAALLRALQFTRQQAAKDAGSTAQGALGSSSRAVTLVQPLHGRGGAASPPGDDPPVNDDLAWLVSVFAEVEQAEIESVLLDARIEVALRSFSYAALCCGGGKVARPATPPQDTSVKGKWSTSATVAAEDNPPPSPQAVGGHKTEGVLSAAPTDGEDGKATAPLDKTKGDDTLRLSADADGMVSAFDAARVNLLQLYLEQLDAEQRAVAAQRRADWVRATLSHSLITAGLAAAKAEGRAWRQFLQWVASQPLHVLVPHVSHGRCIATLRCLWVELSGLSTSYETQPVDAATLQPEHASRNKVWQAITSMPTIVPPLAGASRARLFGYLRERALHVPHCAGQLRQEARDIASLQAAWRGAQTNGQAQEAARVQRQAHSAAVRDSTAPLFERRFSTSASSSTAGERKSAGFPRGGAAAAQAPKSQWTQVAPPDRETPPPEVDFGSFSSKVLAPVDADGGTGGGGGSPPSSPAPAAAPAPAPAPAPAAAAAEGSDDGAPPPPGAASGDIMDFAKIRGGDGQPVDEEAVAIVIAQLREIAEEFKASGAAWADDEFHGPEAVGAGVRAKVQSEWLRPAEYSPAPTLYEDSCDPGDIEQGSLGDCYLLTSMAIIAHDKHARIEDIVVGPNRGWERAGVYVVRLYKNSRWVPILVDDRLPCKDGCFYYLHKPGKLYAGKHTDPDKKKRKRYALPVFARSRSRNELWPSIIEKAVAKYYGSYSAIAGGLVHQALVDMSGGYGDWVNLKEEATQQRIQSGDMWDTLVAWVQAGFMLGCGSNAGSDSETSALGIVQGHAYAVLQCKAFTDSNGTHRLLQLTNPWGHGEWKGTWSDVDTVSWSKKAKAALNYDPATADDDDGLFWMSFEDWVQEFRNVYLVRRFATHAGKQTAAMGSGGAKWHKYTVEGEWRGDSAGGCTNFPDTCHKGTQFFVKPSKPTRLFLSLAQHEAPGKPLHAIGLKLLDNGGKRVKFVYAGEPVAQSAYASVREVTVEGEAAPSDSGTPLVLFVSTFKPELEGTFTLTVFSEHALQDVLPAAAGGGANTSGQLKSLDSSIVHNG